MRFSKVSVYKRVGDGWRRTVFEKAYVRGFRGINFERGGRSANARLTVRIFSPSALEIKPSDMIETGVGKHMPSEKALTVTEISDNLDCINGHVRITAK